MYIVLSSAPRQSGSVLVFEVRQEEVLQRNSVQGVLRHRTHQEAQEKARRMPSVPGISHSYNGMKS